MNTDLITEHLDLWASAVTYNNGKPELTGIQKLRELILELAVRGKLVPQDPEDEIASKLLERIEEEKKRLYKEGKIKKPKKMPEITEEEKPFELPANWAWFRVGSLLSFEYGNSLPKKNRVESGNVDVYGSNGIVGKHDEEVVSGTCIVIGRKGSVGALNIAPGPSWITDVAFYVIPPEGVDLKFAFLLLSFLDLEELGKGIKPGINRNEAHHLVAVLPPTEEQQRIVEKVDELMALCDRLEQQTNDQINAHETLVDTLLDTLIRSQDATELADNWARLAEHFDTLFTTEHSIDRLEQTILQLAVMGHLVPQDPDDEPASKLLERVAAKKQKQRSRRGKGNKYKNASDKPKPYQLPPGWEWCHFDDIGNLSRGKSKHRPRNDPWLFKNGFMPLVQTGDIAKPGRKIDTFTYLYNENGVEQSLVWPQGTLCITIAANIGETGILDFEACFPDSVVGFIPYESTIKNEYIEYFLRTAQKSLEDFAPATAQKNINLNILRDLLIPLPPITELNRIIDRVDELMTLCDRLKACLKEAEEIQSELAESIVNRA